jgi:hypothetical protein
VITLDADASDMIQLFGYRLREQLFNSVFLIPAMESGSITERFSFVNFFLVLNYSLAANG